MQSSIKQGLVCPKPPPDDPGHSHAAGESASESARAFHVCCFVTGVGVGVAQVDSPLLNSPASTVTAQQGQRSRVLKWASHYWHSNHGGHQAAEGAAAVARLVLF